VNAVSAKMQQATFDKYLKLWKLASRVSSPPIATPTGLRSKLWHKRDSLLKQNIYSKIWFKTTTMEKSKSYLTCTCFTILCFGLLQTTPTEMLLQSASNTCVKWKHRGCCHQCYLLGIQLMHFRKEKNVTLVLCRADFEWHAVIISFRSHPDSQSQRLSTLPWTDCWQMHSTVQQTRTGHPHASAQEPQQSYCIQGFAATAKFHSNALRIDLWNRQFRLDLRICSNLSWVIS
jgi:hypothetical protein